MNESRIMKQTILVAVMFLFAACARAEIVRLADSNNSLEAFRPGAKIYVSDTATKSYNSLVKLLEESGYQVVERDDEADYFFSIFKLQMLTEVSGKKIYIDLYNIDDYKEVVIPPAAKEVDLPVDMAVAKSGYVRGIFDTDAGVISQGARLTGSSGGGMIVGMIGSLIGGVVDRMALASSQPDDPPLGTVIARGTVGKQGDSSTTATKIVIAVNATTPEKPGPLFEEALRFYVGVVKNGFVKLAINH